MFHAPPPAPSRRARYAPSARAAASARSGAAARGAARAARGRSCRCMQVFVVVEEEGAEALSERARRVRRPRTQKTRAHSNLHGVGVDGVHDFHVQAPVGALKLAFWCVCCVFGGGLEETHAAVRRRAARSPQQQTNLIARRALHEVIDALFRGVERAGEVLHRLSEPVFEVGQDRRWLARHVCLCALVARVPRGGAACTHEYD